ncbi:MAG TPA: tetratricopeptide repeat protein, partial [Pyrinomonadaceae bacterium]|nr:tetratricopeptide repeat protein [Pyrinomonadaceae bacterium]
LKEKNSSVSAAFGIDAVSLQNDLAKTLAQKSLEVTTVEAVTSATTEATAMPLPPAHAAAILGDLLFQIGELSRAELFLKQAIAADAKEPLANASLGLLLVNQNKFADAKIFLKSAIAVGSIDYRVYFNYAFAVSRDFTTDGMIGEIPDDAAGEIRSALRRSIELAPGFVESYRLFALLDFVRDEDLDNAVTLIRKALEIKNDDADLKLLLARILLRREDAASAKQLAEQVAATGDAKHKAEAGEIIKTAYEYTNALSVSNSENRLTLSVLRPQGVAILKRSWLTDADIAQIEANRINNNLNILTIRPDPGEQQLVGHIERVTCVGGDINFYVRAENSRLILSSSDFAGIRMTVAQEGESSYSIGCGARLEKSLTVINYQPSLPGARTIGEITAISFVPDSFKLKTLREMLGSRLVAIDDDTLRRSRSAPVVINDETIRKSIQDNLRRPQKGETRIAGQIENIECSGDNWVFQVFADGKHLKFVPPRDAEPSLSWFTVVSTQVLLTCGSGKVSGTAVFTFSPADNVDGELHSIEFVPDSFVLPPANH